MSFQLQHKRTPFRLALGRRIVGLTLLLCTTLFGQAAAQVAGVDGFFPGCIYPTVSAAINAAPPGGRVYVQAGAFQTEYLNITKNLIIEAGNATCTAAAASAAPKPVIHSPGAAAPTVRVHNGSRVLLRRLVVEDGEYPQGANLYVESGSWADLMDVDLLSGQANIGGGAYVGGTLTLNQGSLVEHNTAQSDGGGIYVNSGTLVLDDSDVRNNTANADGGGIAAIEYSNVFLKIQSTVETNTAEGNGGGVHLSGGSSLAVLEFSSVHYNTAQENGGGIYSKDSRLHVYGSLVNTNDADVDGGGIYSLGSILEVNEEAHVHSNDAGDNGGGIYVTGGPTVDIRGRVYSNLVGGDGGGIYALDIVAASIDAELLTNGAGGNGGGIAADGIGTLTLDGLVQDNMVSGSGGGAYVTSLARPTNATIDSDFDNNTAAKDGGGLAVQAKINPLILSGDNSTITNNTADGDGGGAALWGGVNALGWGVEILFADNTAGSLGGGLALRGAQINTIGRLDFERNRAEYGGALALDCGGGATNMTTAFADWRDNVAMSHGGGAWIDNNSNVSCRLHTIVVTAEDNTAQYDGGAIAARGRVEFSSVEFYAHRNSAANGRGGAIAALDNNTSGGPRLSLTGASNLLYFAPNSVCPHRIINDTTPDQYCVELRENHAAIDGAAIYMEEGLATIDRTAFLGNTVDGQAAAVITLEPSATTMAVASLNGVIIADHTVETLAVAHSGATLKAYHLSIGDNTVTTALDWRGGSEGQLFNSAVADAPVSIDSNTNAFSDDCNTIFSMAGSRSLGGSFTAGFTSADFVTDAAGRGRFQPSASMIDACATGSPFDMDNGVRADGSFDQGAFESGAVLPV